MTSTGTGVRHSEYNRNSKDEVHFLQIWAKPYQSRLPVKYYARHFSDSEKLDKIIRIVAPPRDASVTDEREGPGPIPIHADIRVSAGLLTPGNQVSHVTGSSTTKTLLHSIMKSGYRKPDENAIKGGAKLTVSSGDQHAELEEGDSLFIEGKLKEDLLIDSGGGKNAEFLLFEME